MHDLTLKPQGSERVELLDAACVNPLWTYDWGSTDKAFVHPVRTPAGHVLTDFEPDDHTWHRGLWSTFKYLNGVNFWDERPGEDFGVQRPEAPPTWDVTDGVATIRHDLVWIGPDGPEPYVHEQRTYRHISLDEQAYAIDVATVLRAGRDLSIDRQPYNGRWGGYGGITFRAHPGFLAHGVVRLSTGEVTDRPLGVRAAWAELSAELSHQPGVMCGVAIFDHPRNPRHPTPWYGGAQDDKFPYLNAATVFHEPMTVRPEEPVSMRHRVVVHDGEWGAARIEQAYDAWLVEAGEPLG